MPVPAQLASHAVVDHATLQPKCTLGVLAVLVAALGCGPAPAPIGPAREATIPTTAPGPTHHDEDLPKTPAGQLFARVAK